MVNFSAHPVKNRANLRINNLNTINEDEELDGHVPNTTNTQTLNPTLNVQSIFKVNIAGLGEIGSVNYDRLQDSQLYSIANNSNTHLYNPSLGIKTVNHHPSSVPPPPISTQNI